MVKISPSPHIFLILFLSSFPASFAAFSDSNYMDSLEVNLSGNDQFQDTVSKYPETFVPITAILRREPERKRTTDNLVASLYHIYKYMKKAKNTNASPSISCHFKLCSGNNHGYIQRV